jgi:SAM-dependent methyltransferase
MPPDPSWVIEHRRAWESKPGLRWYYTEETFRLLKENMVPGRTLEIGTGPGYLARCLPGEVVSTDITAHSGVSVCADVHRLPFRDESFQNVVGVDILHHFAHPAGALREMARVLAPNGRIVLVEPWTGSLSIYFFRLLHQESCEPVADPWEAAMPEQKEPMDGNTIIPKLLLSDRAAELTQCVPALRIRREQTFGILSYFLTGGFQRWGFPLWASKVSAILERWLPEFLMRAAAVRVLFVLERHS